MHTMCKTHTHTHTHTKEHTMLNTSLLSEVKVIDVVPAEAPTFISAYIDSATFEGRPVTEDELWELNCWAEDFITDAAYEVYAENKIVD
jgi:hypothetical protein